MMMKTIMTILLTAGFSLAGSSEVSQFRKFVDEIVDTVALFDPVWATGAGMHDKDSLMPDYSAENILKHKAIVQAELDSLLTYDTAGWSSDDQIDYRKEVAELKSLLFDDNDLSESQISMSFYFSAIYSGLYNLLISGELPFIEKSKAFRERMTAIPDYLNRAKGNVKIIVIEDYSCASFMGVFANNLMENFTQVMIDSLPSLNAEISTERDKAIWAIQSLLDEFRNELTLTYPQNLWDNRQEMEHILEDYFFVDFDLDSLQVILESEYAYADSMYHYYDSQYYIDTTDNRSDNDWPEMSSIDEIDKYYQAEIDTIKKFLIDNDIMTVPDNFPVPRLAEYPEYLTYGDQYRTCVILPAFYDKNQTATFYIDKELKRSFKYNRVFYKYPFRQALIENIIPGNYLQNYLSYRQKSLPRAVSDNSIAMISWSLYIKEYMYQSGILGDDPELLAQLYSEIRDYEMAAIIELGMNLGKYGFTGAYNYVEQQYGEDEAKEFSRTSHCTCLNPTYSLAGALGRYLIRDMREKARAKEGRKFSIRHFHDRILAEGDVPLMLIAWKYGWQ